MLRTNIRRQGFIATLLLSALIVGMTAAAPWTKGLSQATDNPPPAVQSVQTTVYGLHSLARSQTLRLSVVNTGLNDPPDPVHEGENDPPEPVRAQRVTLAFDIYDRAGDPPDPIQPSAAGDGSVRNLKIVRRESRTFMLHAGEAAAIEIDVARAGEAVGAWVLANPPDPITPGENNPPDPIRSEVSASLELRQGNSTQFVLPGTTRGFNPQPDPPRY